MLAKQHWEKDYFSVASVVIRYKLHKRYKKHIGPLRVTHFKGSTSVFNWRILIKFKERDGQLVKCAFLKEMLYLFIRMETKQTSIIIDAHHVPNLNKTVSDSLLSRITPYVDGITGDDHCELWNNLNYYTKKGKMWGSVSSIHRFQESLCVGQEGGFV